MRFIFSTIVVLLCAALFLFAGKKKDKQLKGPDQKIKIVEGDPYLSLFDENICDGFSYPFGDGDGGGSYTSNNKKYHGWFIATKTGEKYSLGIHTGEDWNGTGGGNTDLGQPVFATAGGKIIAAKDYGAPWGNVIYIEHKFVENAKLTTVYSLYAHLDEILVEKDETVNKRQKIGTIGTGHNSFPAHLHFEIRKQNMEDFEVTYWPSTHKKDLKWVMDHYFIPSDFIDSHRRLGVPAREDFLLVAHKSKCKMHVIQKGREIQTYDIALSQNPVGHKMKEGDLKLPEGEYYITEKSRGPVNGDYKAYFGPAWMRISYPNKHDAMRAFASGSISKSKRDAILEANKKMQQPPSNTGLGGGIGIHGWAGDWPEQSRALTWGCISMRNKDLDRFYEIVPLKAKILILP